MALAAGAHDDLDRLDDFLLQAPLLIPEHGAVQLQLLVGPPDEAGRCRVTIYSRPLTAQASEWVCHCTGVLSAGAADDGCRI